MKGIFRYCSNKGIELLEYEILYEIPSLYKIKVNSDIIWVAKYQIQII